MRRKVFSKSERRGSGLKCEREIAFKMMNRLTFAVIRFLMYRPASCLVFWGLPSVANSATSANKNGPYSVAKRTSKVLAINKLIYDLTERK